MTGVASLAAPAGLNWPLILIVGGVVATLLSGLAARDYLKAASPRRERPGLDLEDPTSVTVEPDRQAVIVGYGFVALAIVGALAAIAGVILGLR